MRAQQAAFQAWLSATLQDVGLSNYGEGQRGEQTIDESGKVPVGLTPLQMTMQTSI